MAQPLSEQQVFLKLSALCASAEHCSYEMTEKMRRWQVADDVQAKVMQRLVSGKYVDDERYARSFVNDKIKYNKWGRRKVEQALYMKHIPQQVIARALDEVDPQVYDGILRPLLQAKSKTVKARNDYELKAKLTKFALSRGFTPEVIRRCIGDLEEDCSPTF